MFTKKIDKIYDHQFDEINISVANNQFNINLHVSDDTNISELSIQAERITFLHNKINPSRVNYKVNVRNIIFTGDVDVILKLLKDELFIFEELYTHLREDKALNDFITLKNLEAREPASNNQTFAQDTITTSSQMPFFKTTSSTLSSAESPTFNTSINPSGLSISSSEMKEIDEILERFSKLSHAGKKLFLERLNITSTIKLTAD